MSKLVKQEQTEEQRVKYIEFMGAKNGASAVVAFIDQHGTLLGRFPLNRFAVETINAQMSDWLKKTD